MVNFCVFSLLLSYAPQEPSGNISLWSPPLPLEIKQIDPPPPWKIRSLPRGGMDIFWNHTMRLIISFFYHDVNFVENTYRIRIKNLRLAQLENAS